MFHLPVPPLPQFNLRAPTPESCQLFYLIAVSRFFTFSFQPACSRISFNSLFTDAVQWIKRVDPDINCKYPSSSPGRSMSGSWGRALKLDRNLYPVLYLPFVNIIPHHFHTYSLTCNRRHTVLAITHTYTHTTYTPHKRTPHHTHYTHTYHTTDTHTHTHDTQHTTHTHQTHITHTTQTTHTHTT